MAEHRVRLTDEDVELIVAALSARTAALSGMRRQRTVWLARRLAEMTPGNPRLILGKLAVGVDMVSEYSAETPSELAAELAAGMVYE